jgi:hypothetical protein
MQKLTKRIIDDTPRPMSGQVFIRDSVLRGFALRVTKGAKTFVLSDASKAGSGESQSVRMVL